MGIVGLILTWIAVRLPSVFVLPIPAILVLVVMFDCDPPVYFVARNVDVTTRSGQQAVCGRFSGCQEYSLSNILEQERKRPEVSYIAEPTAVWLDDFLLWLNPVSELCCRLKPAAYALVQKRPLYEVCSPEDDEDECKVCWSDKPWSTSMDGFPEGNQFMEYLDYFLEAEPSEYCPLSGAAAYQNALVVDSTTKKVKGSHFRTYHTVLKTQVSMHFCCASNHLRVNGVDHSPTHRLILSMRTRLLNEFQKTYPIIPAWMFSHIRYFTYFSSSTKILFLWPPQSQELPSSQ